MEALACVAIVVAVVVVIAAVTVISDLIGIVFEFITDNALIILVLGSVIFGGVALVVWLIPG